MIQLLCFQPAPHFGQTNLECLMSVPLTKVMELNQAIDTYPEYHRMNSGKKYD